jgi:hypothetical protein
MENEITKFCTLKYGCDLCGVLETKVYYLEYIKEYGGFL